MFVFMLYRTWIPVAAAVGLASIGLSAQKGSPLQNALRAGGDYIDQYSRTLGAVAAEEEYVQFDTTSGRMTVPKRINTEFVLLGFGGGEISGYRDAFGIDTSPIRPRDNRLLALLTLPTAASLEQARQLTEDSVRYYLSPNLHALDQPTAALEYLRKDNQERSTFKLEGVKMMNGVEVATLKFSERSMPRILPSAGNEPAIGRFWIEVATGIVRQTELGLVGKTANVTSTVKYGQDSPTGPWLPVEMHQQFNLSVAGSGAATKMGAGGDYNLRQSLEGRATYAKFRQVAVDLSKIK